MGLSFSKQEPVRKIEDLSLQHHLINYISKSLYIRNLVSRQRRRMLISGFDLDMSYITDRLLAMSFPAERMRAMYRNPLWQVKFVLDVVHEEHYKIYNLCIEEKYDSSHFHGRVEVYPFDDNHVPPLTMVKMFCENVFAWLSSHAKHIAVIHCMAGKGRTGLMVCAYLVYTGMSAEEALQLYAQKRTMNNIGVSIPSQRRYVGYWASVLSFPKGVGIGPPEVNIPEQCSRDLRRIRLYDAVNTDSVYFVVSELREISDQLYRPAVEVSRSCCRETKKGSQQIDPASFRYYLSFFGHNNDEEKPESIENSQNSESIEKSQNSESIEKCQNSESIEKCQNSESIEKSQVVQMDTESPPRHNKTCLDCNFPEPIQVTGDMRITFYQKMNGGRLFYACFNTSFIKNSLIQLKVDELDKLGGRGKSICGPEFRLEILFGPENEKNSFSTGPSDRDEDDYSSSDLL